MTKRAGASFSKRTGKFLYGVAIKSGLSDGDARDVMQEKVVSVAKALREGRFKTAEGSSFKAWLLQIVRRRIADHLRKKRLPVAQRSQRSEQTARAPTIERVPDPGGDLIGEIWEEEWVKNWRMRFS